MGLLFYLIMLIHLHSNLVHTETPERTCKVAATLKGSGIKTQAVNTIEYGNSGSIC